MILGIGVGVAIAFGIARTLKKSPDADPKLLGGWARYAHERGLRYVAPGALLGEQMPMMEETSKEGVAIRVDLDESRSGDVRAVFTRLVARAAAPQSVRFRCEARGADLAEGLETLATLDMEFDEDFALTAETDDAGKAAARMVDGDVRTGLIALRARRGVRLDYDHGEITLSWRGAESDPELLDRARDVVRALALSRMTTTGYR